MRRKVLLITLGLCLGVADTLLGWSVLAENFLGAFLIFVGLGYCIGGGFFLALSRTQEDGPGSGSDRTLLGLAPASLLFLLAMPLEYLFLPAVIGRGPAMQWLGLGVILLGLGLRLWARRALKESYQGNLQVQTRQRLVQSGPYRWLRHPGYLAFILLALGLALGFSSLSGLLGWLLLIAALRRRIQVEEQMLVRAFGEEYREYAGRTHRLLPGIW